jgi:CheY-like chemotaxis protein
MTATGTPETRPFVILLVEDSPQQQALTRRAVEDSSLNAELRVVGDGETALQYLRKEGEYTDAPRPDIILLDLNMPRMDGNAVLSELRSDERLQNIPVTVLTTSSSDADITASYARGANAFVTKPSQYDQFVNLFSALGQFCAHFVKLPPATA